MSHINDEQWEEMLDLLEEDFVGLVKEFVVDSQQRLERIKQAHQSGDNATGLEVAHTLKGASANIGANALSKYCETMQMVCQANMIADAHNVVADIEAEFAQVSQEIATRLAQLD